MSRKPTRSRTIVEETAERIAFQIASGAYTPGERLPSVRSLAAEYGINPSTVQIVLARLQSSGFVEARTGVGFLVRDIALVGGIETWRYMFRFAQRLPDRAIRLLEQTLATRRLLIAKALEGLAAQPLDSSLSSLRRAVARLELAFGSEEADLLEAAWAELHATRIALASGGQDVLLAIFNSIGEILIEIPEVLAATYGEPESHLAFWRALVADWENGTWTTESRTTLEAMVREFDAAAVDRFRKLIG
ncbi:MAG TPA: GntR family transcriptional regulator [Myxococcota bacterium]|nr:GntR family transcriptional regulator [Myxococcota bacterium]